MNIYRKNLKRVLALFLSMLMFITNKPFVNNFVYARDIDDELYEELDEELDLDINEEHILYDDFILGGNGGSDENGNNKIISSTVEFENLSYYDIETSGTFYYTDDYFKNPSTTYNEHLVAASANFSLAGAANSMEDVKDKYVNAKDFLSKTGFRNITPNEDYLKEPENNSMGSVCANKPIYIKNAGGTVNKYNLISIVTRGANYKLEWLSNFKMGNSGDHDGFTESTDVVYNHFTSFYNEHKDDFGDIPVKIWLVGYSRGAAIANMLGARLTDEASNFNTTKTDIYCITMGTPMGVSTSEHTNLDSYTNIHNIVDEADIIPLLSPAGFGFGRYGIDHPVPRYVSENWHDTTKKNQAIQNNKTFKTKYAKMKAYLDKINPNYKTDITTFNMYKLEPITSTLELMKYTKLGTQRFTKDSKENEYYKGYEYFTSFVNETFSNELMNCSYPGTNYGSIKGRDRYYTKYQDLIMFALEKFYVDENSSTTIEKIIANAKEHAMSFIPLMIILTKFIWTDGDLPERNHYTTDTHPTESSTYYSVYTQLKPVYEALFKDAFSDSDYNFLIDRSDDITDIVMDLLTIDYRTTTFPKQATVGSMIQNSHIASSFHSGLCYLAWTQVEDSYYSKPPVGTINIDGYKSFIFSDLSDTTVKIYDEFDVELGYYTIDSNNVIEESEGLHNTYINIVKSYNPVGLELRIPSNLAYDFKVISDNKTIDKITFKEFFITDNSYYRSKIEKTNFVLNENQSLYVSCYLGGTTKVFSCYPYDTASDYQRKNMKIATISNVVYLSGYDAYSYSSAPLFELRPRSNALNLGMTMADIATNSEIDLLIGNAELASKSEIEETTKETEDTSIISGEGATPSEIEETTEETEDADVGVSLSEGALLRARTSSENEAEPETTETTETAETTEIIEPSKEKEETEESTIEEEIEIETETLEETETEETDTSKKAEIETTEETETSEETEIETESESENQVSAFSNTDEEVEEEIQETIANTTETAGNTYTIHFTTTGIGNFYYFDGSDFVEGISGDSFSEGTRIKIIAPLKYGKSPFYGWTLTTEDGKYLNAEGIDTVAIFDESDSKNSAYEFSLKDYDINIAANYFDGPYYLNIKYNQLKGKLYPDNFPTKFDKLEDFDLRKGEAVLDPVPPYDFLYWYDGKNKYDNIGDYDWIYNDNVTLEAVFNNPGGGGGGPGGGGGSGGSSGSSTTTTVTPTTTNQLVQNGYVTNDLVGLNIYNDVKSGKWVLDSSFNSFKYGINLTEEDILNNVNSTYKIITIDGANYLADGLYKLGKDHKYYLFDAAGNMQIGFKTINGKTYYFEETGENIGAMVQGEKVINGIIYNFDASGEIVHPANGIYTVVEGVWKYFPDDNKWGYEVTGTYGNKISLKSGTFSIKDSDGTYKTYVFDENGDIVNEIK